MDIPITYNNFSVGDNQYYLNSKVYDDQISIYLVVYEKNKEYYNVFKANDRVFKYIVSDLFRVTLCELVKSNNNITKSDTVSNNITFSKPKTFLHKYGIKSISDNKATVIYDYTIGKSSYPISLDLPCIVNNTDELKNKVKNLTRENNSLKDKLVDTQFKLSKANESLSKYKDLEDKKRYDTCKNCKVCNQCETKEEFHHCTTCFHCKECTDYETKMGILPRSRSVVAIVNPPVVNPPAIVVNPPAAILNPKAEAEPEDCVEGTQHNKKHKRE
jgi:hypothetical protein